MPVGCSDCGRPSVGTFDLKTRPDPDAFKELNASDRSAFDRPLCSSCATARKLAKPSQPSE